MQLPLLQVRNLVLRGRPLAPLHDVDGVDLRRVHCRELDEVHRRQGSGLDPCDPCHAMPMPMPMPMPLVNLRQHLTSQHDFACFWNDVRSCTYLIKHLQLPRLGRYICTQRSKRLMDPDGTSPYRRGRIPRSHWTLGMDLHVPGKFNLFNITREKVC